ncbi:benzoylformate decarboxylase [uncultured Jatrophihabitans sp.]|uniref:benzoylformate decarboxylase n=1 Tax=uncultured Jatrophihabitans sp. TaxID=1610747 RepID=UPI0035CA25A6
MTTVRDSFRQVMRELGLTTVFGNPGSTEEPLLTDFPADFDYVLGLQEASVVAMADGYSQLTHRPAFVQLHTSGGVGNALGNIASAWHNRTPLIVFAGQQTREMLLLEPLLTNSQAVDFPRPYVKWSYEVARPQDAPAALLRAYAAAVQPPAGPVFLSVPMDDFNAEADPTPAVRSVSTALQASAAGLRGALDLLRNAESPAMIVGGAVSARWDDVVRLAETLRCPVWAAPEEGRPGFPETHPQFQGAAPPAIAPLAETLTGHDVVLVVGAPVFRYYPYEPGDYLPAGTRLVHLTDDPAESARAPVGDSILTDPAAACGVLADELSQATRLLPNPRTRPEPAKADGAITAEYLFDAVQRLRPETSIILQESLSNLSALHERIPVSTVGAFFSMSSGILGYALPAAVGVALAEAATSHPRKVICLLGDGAAQYSIQALWTAALRELPILFIVLRNGEYAILKSFARELDTPDIPGLDLPGIDTPRIAEGYGCTSSSVTDPAELDEVLSAALARSDGPHLLQVTIDPSVPPLL